MATMLLTMSFFYNFMYKGRPTALQLSLPVGVENCRKVLGILSEMRCNYARFQVCSSAK
jgi:hypothetical protein